MNPTSDPSAEAAAATGAPGTAERLRNQAAGLAGEMKAKGKKNFRQQQGMVADNLGGVAGALHQTAQLLTEQQQANTARLVDRLATNLESVSSTLRDQDLDRLLAKGRDFAQRQPAMVMLGGVAAGFFLARFFKSSPSRLAAPTAAAPARAEATAAAAPGPDPRLEAGAGELDYPSHDFSTGEDFNVPE